MSIFRFTDLPEEIGTMVVQEVVNEYGSYPFDWSEMSDVRSKRLSGLEKLCGISCTFVEPAQAKLFEVIIFEDFRIIDEFLECVKSNSRLGATVKEIFSFHSIRDFDIGAAAGETVDQCVSLERLTLAGQKISLDLSILSRAKSKDSLSTFD